MTVLQIQNEVPSRNRLIFVALLLSLVGDIWMGITLPLAIFPVLACLLANRLRLPPINATPSLLLLSSLGVIVGIQVLSGAPPAGRSDLLVYLPIVYAVLALWAASAVDLEDAAVRNALIYGGVSTAVVMFGTAFFAPQDFYFLPSQYIPSNTEISLETGPDIDAIDGGLEHSVAGAPFYEWKRRLITPLGFSNYLSAFLMFSCMIALFSRSYAAAIFLGCSVAATGSRFGIAFLVVGFICWLLYRRGLRSWVVPCSVVAATFAGVVTLIAFAPSLRWIPDAASLQVRVDYWRDALVAWSNSPFIGMPRSYIMEAVRATVFWNPHNAALWIGTLFGAAGLIVYGAYLVTVCRLAARLSLQSEVWAGVLVGLSLLISMSMVESIAVSPAFEILMALLLGVALRRSRSEVVENAA
ncbi:O-antigen ligase family protein [Devosia albogilva]|uniref:O-antigen ligase family protein n=1 Tax=Devosia albogilva TaxID=429726 RepID=A0ABW5QMT6_9HYPH